jgi:hypothetical protein
VMGCGALRQLRGGGRVVEHSFKIKGKGRVMMRQRGSQRKACLSRSQFPCCFTDHRLTGRREGGLVVSMRAGRGRAGGRVTAGPDHCWSQKKGR